MKFGLTEKQYNFIHSSVAIPLKKSDVTIWVFGSRARGDYKKFSDLDIVISTENDILDKMGKIQENLIESNFPYKVDLVLEKNLASSYKESFLKDRILF